MPPLRDIRLRWAAHRQLTKAYRRDIREDTRFRFFAHLRKINLPISLLLGVLGALVYWWWASSRNVPVDLVGLILAAAVPAGLYMLVVWFMYRLRAPFHVYSRYRQLFDQANPSSPWKSAIVVRPHGATLSLFTTDVIGRIARVICTVWAVPGHGTYATKSLADLPYVERTKPVVFEYPDDFQNAAWPLERGTYAVTWNIGFERGFERPGANQHEDVLKISKFGRWWG